MGKDKVHCKPLTVSDAPNALTERIKELNCLYGISNLFENQDVSLSWIMQRAVELIPEAWQYPENACARINIDGQDYISAKFKKTIWCQRSDIILNGKKVGSVEVYYRQIPPDSHTPFIEEEDRLLRAIGERLSKVLWLKRYEEAIKESEERYRILTEQVDEGVVLVQNSQFCYVNPAFCKMFNIPSPEAINESFINAPSAGNVEELSKLYSTWIETIDKNTTQESCYNRVEELHSLERLGNKLWIQASHTPISFKGSPALLSTFKDVTQIKEEQIAAQKMAELLDSENRILRSSLKERYRLGDILGHSPEMQIVYELILKAAGTDANVAIFGESGSGKELVARAIHDHSVRNKRRFIAVNCGAIQETLFEREFFGHRKGSFSGAHADSSGYLDMADKGTLFLDEVSELSVNMQAKLLRAIESGDYRPIGSTESVTSDFRVISASNVALTDRVANGSMRADFFYRIQIILIELPPLRNRRQDIPLLVDHFLRQIESKMPSCIKRFRIPGTTMDRLIDYNWPGNVRELRNVLQRYVTLGNIEFLQTTHEPQISQESTKVLNLRKSVQEMEQTLIKKALEQSRGNRTQAAKLLGISRRALFRKMLTLQVS